MVPRLLLPPFHLRHIQLAQKHRLLMNKAHDKPCLLDITPHHTTQPIPLLTSIDKISTPWPSCKEEHPCFLEPFQLKRRQSDMVPTTARWKHLSTPKILSVPTSNAQSSSSTKSLPFL